MAEQFQKMNCPNCARQIFQFKPGKSFHISIPCNHCKAIYEIENKTDGTLSFKQTREPKYSHLPKERKRET